MAKFVEGVGIVLDQDDVDTFKECEKLLANKEPIFKNLSKAIDNYLVGYEVKINVRKEMTDKEVDEAFEPRNAKEGEINEPNPKN